MTSLQYLLMQAPLTPWLTFSSCVASVVTLTITSASCTTWRTTLLYLWQKRLRLMELMKLTWRSHLETPYLQRRTFTTEFLLSMKISMCWFSEISQQETTQMVSAMKLEYHLSYSACTEHNRVIVFGVAFCHVNDQQLNYEWDVPSDWKSSIHLVI